MKGRGTAWQLAHRFSDELREETDDGWDTQAMAAQSRAEAAAPATQVREEHARSVLVANDSPDIHFDLSINPYRGCEHGCVYCFARPTHSYLNLSPGLDFETRLVAKVNVAERLRAELARPGYQPRSLNLGSATDAYQPIERRWGLTRAVIQVLAECQHPFSIITKSAGIERDLDLLVPLAARRQLAVYVSITTLDPALARILEPRASSAARRLRGIERLAQAGIPVGISVSPIIPFINEPELERILSAASQAGAQVAFSTVLRLPWEVSPLFQQWLQTHFPDRAERVMARVHDLRGGRDNDPRFGSRMTGQGVWAQMLRQRFMLACRRAGLGTERIALDASQFQVPMAWRQASPGRRVLPIHAVAPDAQGQLF